MMKILAFGLILCFKVASADFPESCMKMLDLNVFLYDCCQYPVIEKRPEVYDTCLTSCTSFDYCCFQECSAKESGTYIEGENSLNSKRLKEIFAFKVEKLKYKNLTEEWKKVLSDSVDKCNAPRSADLPICDFVYERMSCIFKENFLNCPNFSDKENCKAVKTEMEACGNEKGSWRFLTDAFNKIKTSYSRRYAESHD